MHADIVVVGAGAAGCVIASRLSERHGCSVLLLEAGAESVSTWPELVATRTATQSATPYTRGRGIGGSAALNAMVATVGEPDDYDEWDRTYGCVGWSWRDVRPWFGRVELPMRRPRKNEVGPLAATVLSSIHTAELAPLTRSSDGQRASVNEVYLDRARRRANLRVQPDALVDRVLLDGRRAVGVRLADGDVIDAGTVVVCAGALHSPAILLRSGVDREGIGHGLHDHPSISLPMTLTNSIRDSGDRRPTLPISVLARDSYIDRHDLQVVPFDSADGAALMAGAMRVYSRGTVRLAAPDPATDPIVEFKMLTDERDLDLLRAASQRATQIARSDAVAAAAAAEAVSITDDWLRGAVGDYVHAAGSCRMGAASDPLAVVDPQCRVIDYESLIVCDASVMPNLPRANPCVPTVMIAERVAEMIDND